MKDVTDDKKEREAINLKSKLFPTGDIFTEAVRAYRIHNKMVKGLAEARESLYAIGRSDLAKPITLELRRYLATLGMYQTR